MPSTKIRYEDALAFKRVWDEAEGDDEQVAKILRLTPRHIRTKRRLSEQALGTSLPPKKYFSHTNFPEFQNLRFDRKKEYTVLIGSDKHNLPGHTPQAWKAFLHLAEESKPDVIVLNGDFFDFAAVGRWHRIGWAHQPLLSEELEWGVSCLNDVKELIPKAVRYFALGNHDMRFDGKLSNCLPEVEGIEGCHLEDHLKGWRLGLSVVFNDCFIVKHRYHAGIHSSYNDVLRSGRNIATGHDHKLNIRPWTDYSGTRYGIKTGTLSDLWDEVFAYTENNPVDWQPGCVHVTVLDDEIFPVTCPMVTKKTHPKWGKIRHHGKWYG